MDLGIGLFLRALLSVVLLIGSVTELNAADANGGDNALRSLDRELQAIKQEAVDINQALLELEEAVLYPRDLQLIVFVSLSPESAIRPESVQLRLNTKLVADRKYTDAEVVALRSGGAHRLYTGRLPYGQHLLVTSFVGFSKMEERYQRQTSAAVLKGPGPTYVKLEIGVAGRNGEPKLTLQEW